MVNKSISMLWLVVFAHATCKAKHCDNIKSADISWKESVMLFVEWVESDVGVGCKSRLFYWKSKQTNDVRWENKNEINTRNIK